MNRLTYLELGRRAAAEAPVVVDATFRFAAARSVPGAASDGAICIECRAPAAVIARRAAARSSQPDRVSDADAAIATRQLAEWEPLTEIPATNRVVVATDRSAEASCSRHGTRSTSASARADDKRGHRRMGARR